MLLSLLVLDFVDYSSMGHSIEMIPKVRRFVIQGELEGFIL